MLLLACVPTLFFACCIIVLWHSRVLRGKSLLASFSEFCGFFSVNISFHSYLCLSFAWRECYRCVLFRLTVFKLLQFLPLMFLWHFLLIADGR